MSSPSSASTEAAARVWSAMHAFVTAQDRRRELQETLDLGCGLGRVDDRVPFAQSVTYVAAARAAGQDARLLEVDGDHFSVADARAPTWPAVIRELEELMGAARRAGP